jgi:hypothetical protein
MTCLLNFVYLAVQVLIGQGNSISTAGMEAKAAKGSANRSFKAGNGAQFTFNFNFIPSAGEGEAPGPSSISQSSSTTQAASAGKRVGGPSFCFNFNIPASMAPQFMSNFANQVEQMTGGELSVDALKLSASESQLTKTTEPAKPTPSATPAQQAPAKPAASSARPWETAGIKQVETPAWAKAAMGQNKVMFAPNSTCSFSPNFEHVLRSSSCVHTGDTRGGKQRCSCSCFRNEVPGNCRWHVFLCSTIRSQGPFIRCVSSIHSGRHILRISSAILLFSTGHVVSNLSRWLKAVSIIKASRVPCVNDGSTVVQFCSVHWGRFFVWKCGKKLDCDRKVKACSCIVCMPLRPLSRSCCGIFACKRLPLSYAFSFQLELRTSASY